MAAAQSKTPLSTRKIFLLYPYYWPFYKAGGPVQSLFNLATLFRERGSFYLVSRCADIDGSESAIPIEPENWSDGPNGERIYFAKRITPRLVWKLIKLVKPDVILINGMFNISTTLPGIVAAKWLGIPFVISPRGMFQPWALRRRSGKKKLALFIFKRLLSRREQWHATDDQEGAAISEIFGRSQVISIAPNVPRMLTKPKALALPSQPGPIRLVFLSLINPNKNLHLVIDAVNHWQGRFSLDIYGPVIDANYWRRCQQEIQVPWISYKGAVVPWEVTNILQQYHFFVLPTEGENFGHAIFDALASGVPVVISGNTPWKRIEEDHAGLCIDLKFGDALAEVTKRIASMNDIHYQQFRQGAFAYAERYVASRDFANEYKFLLGRDA